MLPKSHACPAHGLSTHTWTREHTHRATCGGTFSVSHSDTERYLAGLELSPSHSWRLPLRAQVFGVPHFICPLPLQCLTGWRCPSLPRNLLSWDLSVSHHVLPCLVSAILILVAKCTLPFQKSQQGQGQVGISAWEAGWDSGCGDVHEG